MQSVCAISPKTFSTEIKPRVAYTPALKDKVSFSGAYPFKSFYKTGFEKFMEEVVVVIKNILPKNNLKKMILETEKQGLNDAYKRSLVETLRP